MSMQEQEPDITKEIPLPLEQTEKGRERFNWSKLPAWYVLIFPMIVGGVVGLLAADAAGRLVRSALRVPKEHPANKYFDWFNYGGGQVGAGVGAGIEVLLILEGFGYLFTHL